MKKVLVSVFALFAAASLFAQTSVSLSNTVGGDSSNIAGNDLLTFDDDADKGPLSVSDRIQLDVSSAQIDSRVRLEFKNFGFAGDNGNSYPDATILKAYVNVRPFESLLGLNFTAGNKFFWKWATPGAYLAATDDYLNHGKLLDDNGVGAVYNFTTDDIGLKFAAGVGAQSRLDLNLGAEFDLKDVVTIGATFQDVTEDSISIGVYAGFNAIENLLLNVGYTYNPSDTSYLQNAYGSNNTQHLAQASIGFNFDDANLKLFADFAAGFNNKVFNGDDDFVEIPETDGVPVYSAVWAVLGATENVTLNARATISHVLAYDAAENDDASVTSVQVNPWVDLKTSVGNFRVGARFFFDSEDGYKGFSVPVHWKYVIASKK